MSTTRTAEHPLKITRPDRRRRWLWVLVAAGATAAVVVVVLALRGGGGGDQLTLTWTGDAVNYDGPTAFDSTVLDLRLENASEDIWAHFAWGTIDDERVTAEEYVAWVAEHPYGGEPPWLIRWQRIEVVAPGASVEKKLVVSEGLIDIVAWDPQGSGATYIADVFRISRSE